MIEDHCGSEVKKMLLLMLFVRRPQVTYAKYMYFYYGRFSLTDDVSHQLSYFSLKILKCQEVYALVYILKLT